eukprot:PhM_4_TR18476/c0_g1_i2/m.21232/K09580/PDIA1, P4HB; protein disulfide-isomerase A1
MSIAHLLALITLFATCFFTTPASAELKKLTKDRFDAFVEDHTTITVVAFCSRQMTICRKYENVLRQIEAKHRAEKNFKIGLVDGSKAARLLQRLGIKTLPSVIVYNHGKEHVYKGSPKIEHIYRFIIKRTEPLVTHIDSADALQAFYDDKIEHSEMGSTLHLVAYYPDDTYEGLEAMSVLAHSSLMSSVVHFAVTHRNDLLMAPGVKDVEAGTVVLKGPHLPSMGVRGIALSEKDLRRFLGLHLNPHFGEYNHESAARYDLSMRTLALLVVDDATMSSPLVQKWSEIAKSHKEYHFIYCHTTFALRSARHIGLPRKGIADGTVLVLEPLEDDTRVYPLPAGAPMNAQAIGAFFDDIKRGDVTPYEDKGEPVPAVEMKDGIIKAVRSTVKKHFHIADKAVTFLVMVSDFCRRCDDTIKFINETRNRIRNASDVAIVTYDPVKNPYPPGVEATMLFPEIFRISNRGEIIRLGGNKSLTLLRHNLENEFGRRIGIHDRRNSHELHSNERFAAKGLHLHYHNEHDCHHRSEIDYFQEQFARNTKVLATLQHMIYGKAEPMMFHDHYDPADFNHTHAEHLAEEARKNPYVGVQVQGPDFHNKNKTNTTNETEISETDEVTP